MYMYVRSCGEGDGLPVLGAGKWLKVLQVQDENDPWDLGFSVKRLSMMAKMIFDKCRNKVVAMVISCLAAQH
jgi:hypothetical protein